MKNFLLSIVTFALLLASCTTNDNDNLVTKSDSTTKLTLTTQPTRTSLGEKSGNTYPVYWSEGDRIVVNGILSEEATIASQTSTEATFELKSAVQYPLSVLYPYTSTTTADEPKVVVPSEQQYTEGTFALGSAPMCGYAATATTSITMKHLVGVLKFPVVGSEENTTLSKIVVRSTNGAKLAGEFAVNCSAGTITACEESSSSITYTLPDNFVLSTTEASDFFISIASGEIGNCAIDFVESSGELMTSSWSAESIKAGIVREFSTITYKRGTNISLAAMAVEEDTFIIFYPSVHGTVKDTDGNPIAGVAVSDGFSVVATDSDGYYELNNVSRDTRYIYISLPAEYEVPTNEFGQPCFYQSYPEGGNCYNFTLTPLAGGKEEKFALFTFADPQVSSSSKLKRFLNEAVPGIKQHCDEVKASGINCYGITLGDIISNSNSSNTTAYRDDMRDGFGIANTGLPVFQVMGNHDNTFCNANQPLFADERNSTFELKAQREHEDMFGPVNYSFNRGDVHIIGMRDIVYRYNNSGSSYVRGFLYSQYEWLKQDLALVPKDKMVVLCVHIQLFNYSGNYIQEVLALLDEYKEAHVISGHTHIQHLYDHTADDTSIHNIFEHNTCAVCGAWWSANIAGDGTPNGYNVFIGEGNTFSDWYYIGYNEGMNTRSHQMRLYRGNAVTGAEISGTDTNNVKGYYAFNFAENVLLANIYNADHKWKIEVYEDDVYSGDMTLVTSSHPSLSALIGDGTLENPRRAADGVVTGHDYYVAGLQLGILNRYDYSGSYSTCYHMYQYTLKNKDANIKVVAIDRFGNRYTETTITEGTDYSLTR